MNDVDKELLRKYYEACTRMEGGYYDARFPLDWDRDVLKNICSALGLDYIDGHETRFYTVGVSAHGFTRTITFSDLLTKEESLAIVNLYLITMEEV